MTIRSINVVLGVLFLSVATFVVSSGQAALVTHLPLDNTFIEAVNGNNLTAGGSPAFVTGVIGQAAQFTTADTAGRGTTTGLPTGNNDFSWATWLRVDATPGTNQNFLNWGPLAGNSLNAAGVNGGGGSIRNNHAAAGNDQTFVFAPTVGTFAHLALVYQNAGPREQRLYVNGVLHSSVGLTGAALNLVNSDLILGGLAGGFEKINATLDDVGIWNNGIGGDRIAAIHGLGNFSTVPLNDSDIDAILAMTTVGQSVSNVGPNNHQWFYAENLVGATGSIGGSVGGGDGFIVLDGTAGTGVSLNGGAIIPEPSTLALSMLGLLSLGFIGWRRRRR